ncbi:bone morphogenetic protein 1-like [Macrosteles quadrilineatus]|uniref:bone morphogenetic protein 1-like n=1 Tax=Macrosteles quadrilineatus TaxID=74068 RepID=UPI0023E0A4E4|nr:bone morphogenetic protein 1-like [Macrosteles quadrilineatus]
MSTALSPRRHSSYIVETKDLPGDSLKTLIADPTAIWPNKTVPYEFAPGEFNSAQQARILDALTDIMSVSCVRFVPRTTQPAYIVLRNNGLGCAAAVGFHNYGPLDLFLGGPSCQTRGTIQHEFLHALGFWHEHTRQDRDQHITILWQNIFPGKEFNFYKRDPSEIMTLNTPYDYNSVMHYRNIAFSKDSVSETIIPKMPAAATRMGQRVRFSQIDLAKLNRFYQCPPTYYHGDYSVKSGNEDEEIDPKSPDQTEDVMQISALKEDEVQSVKREKENNAAVK